MIAACKGMALYSIVFSLMCVALWQQFLAWLTPLSFVILLLGVICLWRLDGRHFRDLGLGRFPLWHRTLALGFLIGTAFPALLMATGVLIGLFSFTPREAPLVYMVLSALIMTAFVACAEELIFRGYFLQLFNPSTKFALLSSSFLWALLHLPNMAASGLSATMTVTGILSLYMIGIALGVGFLRGKRTLWLPFGLHYGYNMSYSLAGAFFEETYHASTWLVGHPAWSPESGFLGLLLGGAILGIVLFAPQRGKGGRL